MQAKLPKARSCAPAWGDKMKPMPKELSPTHFNDHKTVYLYNPNKIGMRFTPSSPESLRMTDCEKSFVVTHKSNFDYEGETKEEQALFQTLKNAHPILIDYVSHQLALELANKPRNMNNRFQITPEDIKNVISAPDRALRPDSPALKKKMAPPKPRYKRK